MQDMDRLLKEAFEELVQQEYERRPEKIKKHWFSLKFRRKMRRTLHQISVEKRKRRKAGSVMELYRPIRSGKKLVILFALLLILIGGTTMGAEPVIRWLYQTYLKQHGNYVEIQKEKTETDIVERSFEKYALTRIPEGYQLESEELKEMFGEYQITYVNESGYALFLRQCSQEKGNIGNITSNREELEEVEVHGLRGYYVKDFDSGSLVLSDGRYLLELCGKFSREELMDMAEGLRIVK